MVTLALRCVALRLSWSLLLVILWLFASLPHLLPFPSLSLSVCLPFRRSMVTLSVSGLVVDCLIPPLPAPSPSPSASPSPVPSPCPALAGCLVIWLAGCLLGYPQSSATFPRPTQPRSLDCPTHSLSLPLSPTRFAEWTSAIPILQLVIPMLRCRVVSFLH